MCENCGKCGCGNNSKQEELKSILKTKNENNKEKKIDSGKNFSFVEI